MKCKRQVVQDFINAVIAYQSAVEEGKRCSNYPRSMVRSAITPEELEYKKALLGEGERKKAVTYAANAIVARLECAKKERVKYLDPCEDLSKILANCELDRYQVDELITTHKERLLGLRMLIEYTEARKMDELTQRVKGYIQSREAYEPEVFCDSSQMAELAAEVQRIRADVVANQNFDIDWNYLIKLDNM